MPSRRVLLTEPPLNPKKNREKLMEVKTLSLETQELWSLKDVVCPEHEEEPKSLDT